MFYEIEPETNSNEEIRSRLKEEQIKIVKIVESFERLDKSEEWQIIKDLVFDRALASIEKELFTETLAKTLDTNKIYRLQGEWKWAKKYSDVNKFVDSYKKQLIEINKKLL